MGGQILALTGSPRRGGNTETLVAAIARGASQVGGQCEIIRLADRVIAPCIGCGGCQKTGRCVILDDMQPLYDKLLTAQAVIIASPIYFYGLSAQTKVFVDRLQALWSRKQLLVAAHAWQVPSRRRGYLVSVAATMGGKVFVGAELCVRYAFDAMGFRYGGDFLVRGVDGRGEMAAMAEKLAEAEGFGRQLVAEGGIP